MAAAATASRTVAFVPPLDGDGSPFRDMETGEAVDDASSCDVIAWSMDPSSRAKYSRELQKADRVIDCGGFMCYHGSECTLRDSVRWNAHAISARVKALAEASDNPMAVSAAYNIGEQTVDNALQDDFLALQHLWQLDHLLYPILQRQTLIGVGSIDMARLRATALHDAHNTLTSGEFNLMLRPRLREFTRYTYHVTGKSKDKATVLHYRDSREYFAGKIISHLDTERQRVCSPDGFTLGADDRVTGMAGRLLHTTAGSVTIWPWPFQTIVTTTEPNMVETFGRRSYAHRCKLQRDFFGIFATWLFVDFEIGDYEAEGDPRTLDPWPQSMGNLRMQCALMQNIYAHAQWFESGAGNVGGERVRRAVELEQQTRNAEYPNDPISDQSTSVSDMATEEKRYTRLKEIKPSFLCEALVHAGNAAVGEDVPATKKKARAVDITLTHLSQLSAEEAIASITEIISKYADHKNEKTYGTRLELATAKLAAASESAKSKSDSKSVIKARNARNKLGLLRSQKAVAKQAYLNSVTEQMRNKLMEIVAYVKDARARSSLEVKSQLFVDHLKELTEEEDIQTFCRQIELMRRISRPLVRQRWPVAFDQWRFAVTEYAQKAMAENSPLVAQACLDVM
jgi:hypothetical protein